MKRDKIIVEQGKSWSQSSNQKKHVTTNVESVNQPQKKIF